jgi:hypothetical protein
MQYIKPQQRKNHKHDPIVKSILITAINILTLHITEAKLRKPMFSVGDLLQGFEISAIYCFLRSMPKDKYLKY